MRILLLFVLISVCLAAFTGEVQANEPGIEASVTTFGSRGIHRLGVPVSNAPELTFGGSIGYGITESNGAQETVHHRLSGIIGFGGAPFSWLSLGMNFAGRYDLYSEGDDGTDWNAVGEPRIFIRGGERIGRWFQLGAELVVWFPGTTAPSFAWEATTLDAKLLASIFPPGKRWFVAAVAGYRWDNSAAAAPSNWTAMSPQDRISLGLSEFDAVLVGLGASYTISKVEIFGEFTGDLLVGDNAPTATSNLRISLGSRYSILPALKLEFLVDARVGQRPGISADDPLVPVESRFSFSVGVSYALCLKKPPKESVSVQQPEPAPPAKPHATLKGRIITIDDVPIPDATVRLTSNDTLIETKTDAEGKYVLHEVPLGQVTVTVTAEDFEKQERTLEIVPEMPALEPQTMAMAIPGSQLRGLVRSFGGKLLRAHVTIMPMGIELDTAQDGSFQVDLEPGTYTVVVEATGFRSQRKKTEIEPHSVTILNVDLHRKKR